MNRRRFLVTALAGALVQPLAAESQPAKVARLGVLLFGTPDADSFPVIRRGLAALGYVDGQNIIFEHRYADGKPERELRVRAGAAYELGMREKDHGMAIQPFPDG